MKQAFKAPVNNMKFQRPLRFYPPLIEPEKPGLLEAVSRGWGADDHAVIDVCFALIEMKKAHERFLAAIDRRRDKRTL